MSDSESSPETLFAEDSGQRFDVRDVFASLIVDQGPSNQETKLAESLVKGTRELKPHVDIATAQRLFQSGALSSFDYHEILKRCRRKLRLEERRIRKLDRELEVDFMLEDVQKLRGLTNEEVDALAGSASDIRREWRRQMMLERAREERFKPVDVNRVRETMLRFVAETQR